MKKIYSLLALFAILQLNAQVGIMAEEPKATLDIEKGVPSGPDGLLIPRLNQTEVEDITATLTVAHNSLMIYLTTASTNLTNEYVNMDERGYYYYDFADDVWLKFIDTDSDSDTKPTGLENIYYGQTDPAFGWRYIDMDPTNYATLGEFATDLEYIPSDLSETLETSIGTFPFNYAVVLNPDLDLTMLGAVGKGSLASGTMNSVTGDVSIALGFANSSNGLGSIAGGISNNATGNQSIALGDGNTASGAVSTAIGNGNTSSQENAVSFGGANTSSGVGSVAGGISNNATGDRAVALGSGNTASGDDSFAASVSSEAIGARSVAIGQLAISSGDNAFALGNGAKATESEAFAFGHLVESSGMRSQAFGTDTRAESRSSTAMGIFNTLESNPQPNDYNVTQNRLFVLGNGDASINRSDAFTVLRDGKVGVDIDNFETTTHPAKLQVNGSTKTTGLTTNFKFGNSVNNDDYTIVLSGNLTLPSSTAENKGRVLVICSDGNNRTLSAAVGETLKDSSFEQNSVTLNSNATARCFQLQSVGDGRWWVIGRN